ncbi:MAG: ABC transporter ATP-binding protein [Deltaproteobacteria bacterium]|nr:ABC transporter ATP-binding protein [Deltaproteobacteria bacterium]
MALSFKLRKSFGAFSLDAELLLGEDMLVLFGPSGAGKSLLLKLISGILRPDEGFVEAGGTVLFDSQKRTDIPIRKRRIGYLFQDYALFPHMTVYENIAYGLGKRYEDEEAAVKERVGGLISVMRLAGLEIRYPFELSGGRKQRTALARTLATGPSVLLLDEPFSALDYQVREKLRADLVNIHGLFPITTIIVTHDLEEAFMLGPRIAVINNGRIEQTASREEVFYRPSTRNVARFVGMRNIFDGRVRSVEDGHVIITNPDLGDIRAEVGPYARANVLAAGAPVTFCVRPEEIPVIRPDRKIEGGLLHNILEGEIVSTTGRGTTHILFIKVGKGDTLLKVEIPREHLGNTLKSMRKSTE